MSRNTAKTVNYCSHSYFVSPSLVKSVSILFSLPFCGEIKLRISKRFQRGTESEARYSERQT